MTELAAVDAIYQSAMDCTACFGVGSELHLPTIDLPQPRWVGPAYHAAKPRVLVVMLNPGRGDGPQLEQNRHFRDLLHRYKRRKDSFTDVLEFQRQHMQVWGRPQGRFLRFYTTALGLELEALSFLNIALCATSENIYPREMLSRCFEAHTAAVALALQPDVIILSGSATHRFATALLKCMPNANVLPMMHYAHRESRQAEEEELVRIRDALASFVSRS